MYHSNILLQEGNISICDLAENIMNDSDYDLLDALDPTQVLEVLHYTHCYKFTENDFRGTARQKERKLGMMKKVILDYVRETCQCIL